MNTLDCRDNISLAVKHYSSLFKLPSLKWSVTLLCLESLFFGLIMSHLNISTFTIEDTAGGLLLGALFLTATLSADYLVAKLLLKKDIILSNFRRICFLSFSSNLLLIVFIGASIALLRQPNEGIFIKVFSLGLFASLSLRALVIKSISFSTKYVKFISALLQPMLISIIAASRYLNIQNALSAILHLALALLFSNLSVWFFTFLLNREGEKMLGIPALKILRAFLANWTEGVERPFEEILEYLSEERDILVSTLLFKGRSIGQLKAILVVPSLHPGPFKNTGSSLIPSFIESSLEEEFKCVVSVPHGISGHELDLVSQAENKKVIENLLNALREKHDFSSRATIFFTVEEDGAKVGCQVFNGCPVITLTTSPETMEDLPLELNDAIVKKAMENGFPWVIAVDSHNSINGQFDAERSAKLLKEAAYLALDKAKALEYTINAIKVGAGKIVPENLGLKEGFGPGGITAIVVDVNGQKTAYITIDGNNMVSGLREKIIASLKEVGVDNGEVFTTDTHAVNAIVLSKRGYHPVGEVVDHERIIGYIKDAVYKALESMELAEAAWLKITVQGVKVIGERKISELSLLVDYASRKARKYSSIFVIFGLLLTFLFIGIC